MPITPTPPFPKSRSDIIRAEDWNQTVNEVIRLDNAKLNRAGDTIAGSLTLNGNLGIGTASPTSKLDVRGNLTLEAGTSPTIFTGTGTTEQNRYLSIINSPSSPSASGLKAGGVLVADSFNFANPGKNNLIVKGNVGIGLTNPIFQLDVGGRMRVRQISNGAPTAGIWFSGYYRQEADAAFVGMKSLTEVGFWGNSGTPNWRLFVNTTNGNLTITGNGLKPGGGAWGNSSDIRLKKNVQPLTGALEKLLQLRPVFYEWKEPEKQGNLTGLQMGFIAQEVENVFPEWIGVDDEGYATLTIRGFEALSVEAFKQLKTENEILKQRCNALEARLNLLTEKLQVLV
ncbi:tail fiber domain-containing protein [Kovacikia minuta CCNUW1]|uniref:tail fiber domain-containing protein n=1 Tax=Kovacikia minuta TaxID=2931930 RepID=UPI001CCA0797|nr:tail fiber domain-containing protein [Kovacikia minuta]UBF27076.1 tail fiber domain-containing protein [Kovacikia minuta CCNUW1]